MINFEPSATSQYSWNVCIKICTECRSDYNPLLCSQSS